MEDSVATIAENDPNGQMLIEDQLVQPGSLFRLPQLKRVFDLLFSVLMLPLLLPFFIVIPLAILLDSRGAIFFKHRRLGKDGRDFFLLKFRTMSHDAEASLQELLANDESVQAEFLENFKLRDDPRITRVGRFLRRTSLDELPQVWNVVKGDMSWVGPRPIVRAEISKYGDQGREFLQGLPGITGLWQVSGRSQLSYEERVRLDLEYLRTSSLWLDIKIIARTIIPVLRCDGAM